MGIIIKCLALLDEIFHMDYNVYVNLAQTLLSVILERDKKLPTLFIECMTFLGWCMN